MLSPPPRLTLHPHDARAVDRLLDSSAVAVSDRSLEPQRMEQARHLLELLDVLPAPEPPTDLVARTLARCGSVTQQSASPPSPRDELPAPWDAVRSAAVSSAGTPFLFLARPQLADAW